MALNGTADKPVPKRSMKRSASSDRAPHIQATVPSGPPDRAATRALLTGKLAKDPAQLAKEEAQIAKRQEEEDELLREQRQYQRELLKQQRQEEVDRRNVEREEQRLIRQEKRQWDAKRRYDARKAIENAAGVKSASLADLE